MPESGTNLTRRPEEDGLISDAQRTSNLQILTLSDRDISKAHRDVVVRERAQAAVTSQRDAAILDGENYELYL